MKSHSYLLSEPLVPDRDQILPPCAQGSKLQVLALIPACGGSFLFTCLPSELPDPRLFSPASLWEDCNLLAAIMFNCFIYLLYQRMLVPVDLLKFYFNLYFKNTCWVPFRKKKCNPYVMLCDVALFWKILFSIKSVDNYCKCFLGGRDLFCQMSFHDICWDWSLHSSLSILVVSLI